MPDNQQKINAILAEINKAISFLKAGTYNDSEFTSHIVSIIQGATEAELLHKENLENLLHKVQQLRNNQRSYWNGHKKILPTCKAQEGDIDKKVNQLLKSGTYSIERFEKDAPIQGALL